MFFGPQTIKHSLTVLGLGLLAGCQSLPNVEDWSIVPKPRQVKVNQVQYSHEIAFDSSNAELSGKEGERIIAFLSNAAAARKDRFYLVSGHAEVPASLSEARKVAVAEYLSGLGAQTSFLSSDFAVKSPARDTVNLIIRRQVVSLPGCPDWSGELTTYNNVQSSNWGCATASNLGLMVAEPGDIVHGRDEGYADGEYAATSINNYRKGETRALAPEDIGVTQSQQKTGEGE